MAPAFMPWGKIFLHKMFKMFKMIKMTLDAWQTLPEDGSSVTFLWRQSRGRIEVEVEVEVDDWRDALNVEWLSTF